MPKFTKEQQEAIDREGSNIIVSAGAGSGKTAVLTARVIRKLKDGIDVNKLLVLTFTNEAANEMKDRIRKAIKKEVSLKKQLEYIDSAYITTFDSYALSVVKKYHYLLNVSNNISIVDSSIIDIKKGEFIDKIFDDLYDKNDELFLKLINDFCMKDDKDIKRSILKINSSLELMYNKKEYLDKYVSFFYSDSYVEDILNTYMKSIFLKRDMINDLFGEALLLENEKKRDEYSLSLLGLVNSLTYEEIRNSLDIALPRIVKNSKEQKEKIKVLIDELKELTVYESVASLKKIYLGTKDYVVSIINIINRLDELTLEYKLNNDSFEFIDISKMAIELVLNHKNVRCEIKNYYNEIMVDEYQDTNDLQEMFISLIENDNVYMVGDIKQSIYRFRNANPLIFKNKYDLYNKNDGGIKIDLLKNFRSRGEVLDDINKIFNKIMDDFLGGANYIKSHQMVFGNAVYDEYKMLDNNNFLEICNYDSKLKIEFSKAEKEAFIIANDIKNKISNNYMVVDKESGSFRKVNYNDFCIIMDRGSSFDIYKKIFEYENVPLVVYKDETLTTEYDIFIIKNLISLIIKVKEHKFDQEFKYYFTSIARSYLFSLEDEDIFKIFKDNKFKESKIYKIALHISYELDSLSCHKLLDLILEKFSFYEKCLSYRNIENTMIRISYLQKLTKNLENLGYTPYMLEDYLSKMIDSESDIRYKLNTKDTSSVKIMNIHKSKGLEFPICYYSGLYKDFNIRDINDRFMFDNKYGIITPYNNKGIGKIFTKFLVKDNYLKDEISERIRLFYVAVTRAREKMIIVAPLDDEIYNDEEVVNNDIRLKYRSFLDMVNTFKDLFDSYTRNIDLEGILSKNYNLYKKKDLSFLNDCDLKIVKKDINISTDIVTDNKFSKVNNKLKTKEELNNMEFGTYIHYLFEVTDFNEPCDNFYINRFLKNDLLRNLEKASIYKEYEFVYDDDGDLYHGIIDLMLCYEDHIDIIDYKLSNIDDDNYKKQLNGYKDYIYNKTGKEVKTYLYSIESDLLKEV